MSAWLLRRGRGLVAGAPLLWLGVFFLIPFLVVFKLSFSEPRIAIPPYAPLIEWDGWWPAALSINYDNYLFLLEDSLYLSAYGNSILVAGVSTLLCLLIGYPMAYFIARSPVQTRNLWLMMVVLPFWTSFLLRVYAWIGFLSNEGVINNALIWLGIISDPIPMLRTNFAVYVGVVYTYLPFMILPLYAVLAKLDDELLEAAGDLGAAPFTTFRTVTLPLSMPGIIAGCLLVFIPAVGEFVIPELLGGADTLMIGRVLWNEFFSNRDWPMASAVAVAMLVFLVVPIMWFRSAQGVDGEGR